MHRPSSLRLVDFVYWLIFILVMVGGAVPTVATEPSGSGLAIEVEKNNGETFEAELEAISGQGLRCRLKKQSVLIPPDQLASIVLLDSEVRSPLRTNIGLRNGSLISARQVNLASEKLSVRLPRQPRLEIDIQKVQSVRLQGPAVATDPKWLGVQNAPSRNDKLVIRRPGGKLDIAEGLILGIADGKVQFDIEGDQIAAPTEKLEGVLFGGRTQRTQSPASPIELTDVYGSKWIVQAMETAEDAKLRLAIDDETTHEMALPLVVTIRWSGGRVMLSREPTAQSHIAVDDVSENLQRYMTKVFGPQSDAQDDLVMSGTSVSEYRIQEGFARARGTVQFDSEVERAGKVNVQIKLDGETVWEHPLETSAPLGYDIELRGANRISLGVVCQGSGAVGTKIRWNSPKLVK